MNKFNRYLPLSIVNLFLRALTIVLKFVLSIIVIKVLSIHDYGVLGLFQSTIVILTFLLGFDFYNYSSRELINESRSENFIIKHQAVFYMLSYLVIIPLIYFIIFYFNFNSKYVNFFISILIVEHLSQELYRILIILKKTFSATLVLFLRSGVWILFILAFFKLNYLLSLNLLFSFWLFGAFISVIYGLIKLKFRWNKNKINLLWIKKGIYISIPFFLGTIFFKLIEFSGRYFLDFYCDKDKVGVYTFFSSITNILFVFVQTIVIIELYPKLIEAKSSSLDSFNKNYAYFKNRMIKFSLLGLILSFLGIYPLLIIVDKEVLFEYLPSYFILLIGMFLFCLSNCYHYALYANNKDKLLLLSIVFSFVFNIILSFFLIKKIDVLGASIAQASSFLLIFVLKRRFWKLNRI